MIKFSSVITVLAITAICYSPLSVNAADGDLSPALKKCIAWQDAVIDLQREIEKKDVEILSSYSHYEVAARNADRMTRAFQRDPANTTSETAAFEWEINKTLKFQESVDGMYSRKLKTQRLRNLLVQGNSCKSYRFPAELIKETCAIEEHKSSFYCQTQF